MLGLYWPLVVALPRAGAVVGESLHRGSGLLALVALRALRGLLHRSSDGLGDLDPQLHARPAGDEVERGPQRCLGRIPRAGSSEPADYAVPEFARFRFYELGGFLG